MSESESEPDESIVKVDVDTESSEPDVRRSAGATHRKLARRKQQANAPLDVEGNPDTRSRSNLAIVRTYEECKERGKTALAHLLRDASTIGTQRKLAELIRFSEYQVTADEFEKGLAYVKRQYSRDDDEE